MLKNRLFILFGVWGMLSVGWLSCSHTDVRQDDPEYLYEQAEQAFKDERYLIAIEKFRDLKNRFPYSSRAVDAELRVADVLFAQESYVEAESAYEIFKELHPMHPRIDYVYFQIAMSRYQQIPSHPGRDLSAAHRAIEGFQQLIERYSGSSFVPKAREYLYEAQKKLAEYENYVADFYFQRKHYLAASNRYLYLLERFPNMGYDEEAMFRLGKSYANIHLYEGAREVLRRFVARFPNSGLRSEAETILKDLEAKN